MPYGSVGPANAARPRRPRGQAPAPGRVNPETGGQMTAEEAFLFASPTSRPSEPLTAGAPFGPGPGSLLEREVPDSVRRALPVLEQLTADPDSPPQLRAIVDYLLHKAG